MKSIVVLCMLSIFIYAVDGRNGEYQFSEFKNGNYSTNQFFTSKGAPEVRKSSRCSKGENSYCWPVIEDQNERVLASYSRNDLIEIVASGRYANISYLYYGHTYKVGKKYKTDYYFLDNEGNRYDTKSTVSSLDRIITKNRDVLDIASDGIYRNGSKVLDSNEKFTHAKIKNNLSGDISVVTVGQNNKIYISNTKDWFETTTKLSKRGDRLDILAVYPVSKDEVVYSVYKYINSYNKGLILGKVNFQNNKNYEGWLFNSENRNVGFSPSIYSEEGIITVSAINSSESNYLYTKLNSKDIQNIVGVKPKHIVGYEDEKKLSFLIGTGLSKMKWISNNKLKSGEGDNEKTIGKVDYDISDSMYKSVYIQGKYENKQLGISYLKNKAEDKGGDTKKASEYINVILDIDGFFSPQSSLRILVEEAEVNGLATYTENNIASIYDVSTKFTRYSAFVMKERGLFHGLDYTQYTMPTLLGYGKDGDVYFSVFDKKSKIQKITYNIGYDELSYAKRYENDYNKFYIQGLAGIGLGFIDLSSEAKSEVDRKVSQTSYKKDSDMPLSIALDYSLDLGYIWQQKAKSLGGLGYSVQLGYKLKGTYFRSKSSSEDENDSLSLEFERNDYWHGAYVSANIIF